MTIQDGELRAPTTGAFRLRVMVEDRNTHRLTRKSKTVRVPERGGKRQLEEEVRVQAGRSKKAIECTGVVRELGLLVGSEHGIRKLAHVMEVAADGLPVASGVVVGLQSVG